MCTQSLGYLLWDSCFRSPKLSVVDGPGTTLRLSLVMMKECGSPVLSVSVGMTRASGTAVGRTVGRHSAGPLAGASWGVAGPAPSARLVAS